MNNTITLIDSGMGTGKTSWIINYMNKSENEQKFIYITPFLAECERVKKLCFNKDFQSPDSSLGGGFKSKHLLKLIRDDKNIVSTHALFAGINEDIVEALSQRNYILVLDEVFDTISKLDIWRLDKEYERASDETKDTATKQTIKALLATKCILVHENYSVEWIDQENPQPKYALLKNLCDRNMLFLVDGELLLWSFPTEVFKEYIFSKVFILTHMFDAQIQSYYFKYHNVEYSEYHIETINNNLEIVKTINKDFEKEWVSNIDKLIEIVEGSINKKGIFLKRNGNPIYTALSKTWYTENPHKIIEIRQGVTNFFLSYAQCKGEDKMWTCFKRDRKHFKCSNIAYKNWVAFNSRATNDYINKKAIAYCVNRYVDPFILKFFGQRDISVNQEQFALSEMMQFIFRSAIRNGEKIIIYIPSERMRNILKQYLGREAVIVKDEPDEIIKLGGESDFEVNN
jgi:hypothetical protein